ncbi:PREDICTED: putative uncharacterized protein DDB_G0278921 [Trachymyrmex cornetzi]|uniref:putative uncharacterized protein DDB_G0278921 n=1 Tax=Trachymyrmex cornetzi TaxID=471704 RepID=UPI00084F821B|nr:PREDICTED: putative uncharacterized protein DDB_G0278921 [Trachymyrmex cornetzi]
MQYSACGRESSGQKKKSFCNTRTFECIRDVLIEKFSVSEKEIISKTSRWFTGAIDRAGGRKQRNDRSKSKDDGRNDNGQKDNDQNNNGHNNNEQNA